MSKAEPAAHDPVVIFAALADRTRLGLLRRLSEGETQCIARLSLDTRLTRQAVTKHLQVLEHAGLVTSARVGRESLYAFRPGPVMEAQAFLDLISAQWDGRLARLKAFVEKPEPGKV